MPSYVGDRGPAQVEDDPDHPAAQPPDEAGQQRAEHVGEQHPGRHAVEESRVEQTGRRGVGHDGVVVVPRDRAAVVLEAGRKRESAEADKRARLAGGELGVDMYALRPLLAQLGVVYLDGPAS